MKILKPGKVELRKFVCSNCGCEFVANVGDVVSDLELVRCPQDGCRHVHQWRWDGEPYEEPTQSDKERLTKLIGDWKVGPLKNWPPFLSDYLIANGVTFKEDTK